MTRHCLHCGHRSRAWVCMTCDGTDTRPWALRPGWVQDAIAAVLAMVPTRRLVWCDSARRHVLRWGW